MLSSKPISSPGRPDNFPPPLMRFLRTNVSSRSRGRSRSSPMFFRKKTTPIDSQEPSSPKVTCMGQVRVRGSSSTPNTAARIPRDGDTTPTRRRRWWWLRNGLFCTRVPSKIRPTSCPCNCHCHCQPLWPNCAFFRVASFRRKATEVRQDSTTAQSNFRERYNEETRHEDYELEVEELGEGAHVNANANVPVLTTPPKNALLLTRSRSAPYRSSSLACRFWGSPLSSEQTGEEQKTTPQNGERTDNKKPCSQTESVPDEEDRTERTTEEKLRFFKELEDSIREKIIESENARELRRGEEVGDSSRPLILTRCKSEPARTTQKLNPEMSFWKKRRLGLADSCSPCYL